LDFRIPEDLIFKIKNAVDDYEDRIELLLETLDKLENGK
jgi:hypothetical protein